MKLFNTLVILLIFVLLGSNNLFASEIILDSVPVEVQDELLNLAETWLSIDSDLTSERVKKDLEFFYEYAYDESLLTGNSVESIINNQIEEEQSLNASQSRSTKGSLVYGNGTIPLPSKGKGHMFYVPGTIHSGFVGHVGLYTHPQYVVQAWAGTTINAVNLNKSETNQYHHGKILGQPGITTAEIDEAVRFAETRKGRPYDDWTNNKLYNAEQDSAYNCSEIVWKSWNFKGTTNGSTYYHSRDLDSDGGSAVYPGDIYNSSYTKVVDSF